MAKITNDKYVQLDVVVSGVTAILLPGMSLDIPDDQAKHFYKHPLITLDQASTDRISAEIAALAAAAAEPVPTEVTGPETPAVADPPAATPAADVAPVPDPAPHDGGIPVAEPAPAEPPAAPAAEAPAAAADVPPAEPAPTTEPAPAGQ